MRFFSLPLSGLLLLALAASAPAQVADTKDAQVNETKGLPPRASAADYQAQGKAGTVTIAAEFTGHSVPKTEGPLSTEEYVVVEAALFGADGQRLTLSVEDFSLRVNGKKAPLPSQPFGFVAHTLKDPQWSPPEEAEPKAKSKSGLSTGGQDSSSTPAIVHVPIALQRAMAQYIQKTSMPQGDRPLPQAGLLFFRYFGKTQGIHSLELVYAGPAGKATLALQP